MADQPVNLNRARKARARIQAKRAADANAVRFGRSKAETAQARAEADRIARAIEGLKREE
ncbi:DUF4169 family protein [Rhodosalinus sediminis]|uniref:DUF4169 family protein n=1 Tax=Rhodosalinus sediminis TaxID=1940533 RepID=A0A3D9BYQ1_9RHOB|nr:DUF4169 family protein [Rhodosalinus sediminis]REC58516.1 DUF4169 family protein [Rhodosalinus sediminis]